MKQVDFILPPYRWVGLRSVEKEMTNRRMAQARILCPKLSSWDRETRLTAVEGLCRRCVGHEHKVAQAWLGEIFDSCKLYPFKQRSDRGKLYFRRKQLA